MKKICMVFLGMVLVAGLSLVSCQKKEPATEKETGMKTTGYGEQAEEVVEKAKEVVTEYSEKAGEAVEEAKETAAEYGEKAGEVVEEAQETVSGYGEKVEKDVEKKVEDVGKALEGYGK